VYRLIYREERSRETRDVYKREVCLALPSAPLTVSSCQVYIFVIVVAIWGEPYEQT